MNKYLITTSTLAAISLAACINIPEAVGSLGDGASPPLLTGSAAEPTTGYIVYSGLSQGKQNIYRQDMVGITPSGNPVVIHEDTGLNGEHGDARYPQVTADGRYIVFITRKTTGITGSGGVDELVIMDHEGTEWARTPMGSQYCSNVNYPEIITYEYDADFSQTNFEIIALCADQWPPVSMHAYHFGPSASYFDTQGQLDELPAGEFAVLPSYTAADGGYIFTSQGDSLLFTKYTHNQPGADKGDTGQVHIDAASRYDGGVCPLDVNLPCPVVDIPPKIENIFAPSVSPDGAFLIFNSEVYKDEAGVGQEFFVLDLPSTDLLDAYTPKWVGNTLDLGHLSHINDMDHANNAGDHYGTFTVNGQYQYTIHGDGILQIAPDLTTVPITVPSPSIDVWETGWFYKN